MPPIYTRFRSRMEGYPGLKSGKIICGQFYRLLNNVWTPIENNLGEVSPFSVFPIADYSKIETVKDNVHKGPPWKDGGDFATIKVVSPSSRVMGSGTYDTGENRISDNFGSNKWRYVGGFTNPDFYGDGYAPTYFTVGNISGLLQGSSLLPSMGDFGPEAYARMRPRLQTADVMVDLAESRDIPRMLRRTSAEFHSIFSDYYASQTFGGRLLRTPRRGNVDWRLPPEIGNSFLNAQFGWAPFISSLGKIGKVIRDSNVLIDQIKKNNGIWIKRKWTKDEYTTRELLGSGDGIRCEPAGNTVNQMCVNGLPPGHWELYREVTTRVYAVGRFKYYRPEFDASIPTHNNSWNALQRHLTILGLRINASNIYNATPWTWLGDYFSNAGDLVDQLNDWGADGIVCKYMYLMNTQTVSLRLKQRINFHSGPVDVEWSRNILTKQREGAGSPFDFRLTLPLTARQLAILAALGASRKTASQWSFG